MKLGRRAIASICLGLLAGMSPSVVMAAEESDRAYDPLRPQISCPTEVGVLTDMLLRDVPSYTNRVLQRTVAVLPRPAEGDRAEDAQSEVSQLGSSQPEASQSGAEAIAGAQADPGPPPRASDRRPYRPSHVMIAGRPEYGAALDLADYALTTDPEGGGPLIQIFFTTLSRQWTGAFAVQRPVEVQAYHWLFLARTHDGWRMAFMYSAVDDADTPRAALPPFESSDSSVGQAVSLWLRDCRAGAIYPLAPEAL